MYSKFKAPNGWLLRFNLRHNVERKTCFFSGVSVRQDCGHWIDEFLPAHAWFQAKTFKCRWDRTFVLCTAKQDFECQMEKSARAGRNLKCVYQQNFAGKQTSSEKSLEIGQIYCSKMLRAPCEGSLQNPSILSVRYFTWKWIVYELGISRSSSFI